MLYSVQMETVTSASGHVYHLEANKYQHNSLVFSNWCCLNDLDLNKQSPVPRILAGQQGPKRGYKEGNRKSI